MENYISGYVKGEEFCDYFKNKNEFYNYIRFYQNRCYYFVISGSKWFVSIQYDYFLSSHISEIRIDGEPPKYILKYLKELED